jgi:hypothetical protein
MDRFAKKIDMDILWYNICMSAFYGTNCLAKKLDCIYVFYACDSTLVNHIPNRDRIMGTPDSWVREVLFYRRFFLYCSYWHHAPFQLHTNGTIWREHASFYAVNYVKKLKVAVFWAGFNSRFVLLKCCFQDRPDQGPCSSRWWFFLGLLVWWELMVMPTALSKLGTTVVVIYFDYHGGPCLWFLCHTFPRVGSCLNLLFNSKANRMPDP